MKVLMSLILLILFLDARSQDTASIVVHKDPRVDSLIRVQARLNEYEIKHTSRFVPGFRILVLSTQDRARALEAKTTVFREFPELKSYLTYQSPYYKLKVGNFIQREEAEAYLENLQKALSGPVYIVHDLVEVSGEQLLKQ